MFNKVPTSRRCLRLSLCAGVLGLGVILGTAPQARSSGFGVEPVIKVEEDWVLVLNEPDDGIDSPQFHTVISPFAHADSYFAQVLWNYREQPDFVSGGLQLQSYEGETRLLSRSVGYRQLSTSAETVSWTQAMTTDGSVLQVEVKDGASSTWGTFGKDMLITVDVALPFLNDYDTNVSAENSSITFGANRVDRLMITQVRRYGTSGLLSVDFTPRIVFDIDDQQ